MTPTTSPPPACASTAGPRGDGHARPARRSATPRPRRCGARWPRSGDALPDDVRVVVVRGEGHSFSAGLDRAMLDPGARRRRGDRRRTCSRCSDDEIRRGTIDEYQRGFTLLRDPRFVSIAAVQGHAIGAGFQLALACDLRVVAEDAQFCMKESALGLVPDLTRNKAAGRARWLRQGARDLRDRAHGRRPTRRVAIGLALAAVAAERAGGDRRRSSPRPHRADGAVRCPRPRRCCSGAGERDLDEQCRLEREAQVRRFRELAALLAGGGSEHGVERSSGPAGCRERGSHVVDDHGRRLAAPALRPRASSRTGSSGARCAASLGFAAPPPAPDRRLPGRHRDRRRAGRGAPAAGQRVIDDGILGRRPAGRGWLAGARSRWPRVVTAVLSVLGGLAVLAASVRA